MTLPAWRMAAIVYSTISSRLAEIDLTWPGEMAAMAATETGVSSGIA
ncbi:MAG: hypothetical protein IT340_06730 [Chloroflexi bacterium]|nr:hypothetical protein [Chloroflexota bacterium]